MRKGDVYRQCALIQDWKDGEERVELRGPLNNDCTPEGDLRAPPMTRFLWSLDSPLTGISSKSRVLALMARGLAPWDLMSIDYIYS